MDRRLVQYLPSLLQPVRDLCALLDGAEQDEVETLWQALSALLCEQFIETADEAGLERWEAMMRLPPGGGLDERRAAILARLREVPPFTFDALAQKLYEMCGSGKFQISMAYHRYELKVRVSPKSPMAEVRALLTRRLPANILLHLDYLYLTHSQTGKMRHQDLAAFTHKTIREMTD